MTFYLGGYDHSVLYTTAQLTEGRSALDQPKQPPAKKTCKCTDVLSLLQTRVTQQGHMC